MIGRDSAAEAPGIVIVGAGECGARTAFALREKGYRGRILLIGEEAHHPYERPPLSKTLEALPKQVADPDTYRANDIAFLPGRRAVSIERRHKHLQLSEGERVPYDRLVLTTGARARAFPGAPTLRTLRTADDAAAIRQRLPRAGRVAIIGGGFIGLELAAAFRSRGHAVSIVEAASRLMTRAVPAEIAATVADRHRAEGVALHLGAAVAEATPNQVALADGSKIEADLVIAGIGAVPNTDLAAAAGLRVQNGIRVDDRFRADDPDIFAAGDCASIPYRGGRVRLESWRAAHDHGNHLAAVLSGDDRPYGKIPWFWSDQYDLTLQIAGLPEIEAQVGATSVRRDLGDDAFILFQLDGAGRLVSAAGIGRGNAVARDIRIAEMLIERGAAPDPNFLFDPSRRLKSLLKA